MLFWVAAFAVFALLYAWYMLIIARRNATLDALAGVDVQLKKRHDLIPNVLTIAKRFMQHEQQLLDDITRLRTEAFSALQQTAQSHNASDVASHFALEQQLQGAMSRLMVQAEAYPELTSAGPMVNAQQTYVEVETNIAAARRFYNTSVRRLRNITEIFPGSVLASAMSIDKYPFFQADSDAHQPVDAKSLLN
ncbi:LemA family protein [Halomonas sp. ISL-60]|uniref:LemA family protein n=1 Tax=Halomonas sp. ISL-56 TaxID=2819149 RepID=UPI001BE9F028|nr:LemA family protein [Halomonas sp. ISL-56]MBT2772581.1 LemA family protein [Halomonas sp. ISL-60]MBT2801211.1 LemA family protein [Halomonas sp. ISL-56]